MARWRVCAKQPARANFVDQASVVVLYDGGCALCHRSVKLLHFLDRRGRLSYAALTPEWSEAYPGGGVSIDPEGVAHGVDAVASALKATGRLGAAMAFVLRSTPGTKKMYRWIATHRYQIFGRKDRDLTACPAPYSWHGRPLRFTQTPPLPRR